MKQNIQKRWLLIDIFFWVILVFAILFVFIKKLTPIYTQETIAASDYDTSDLLAPGDRVVQSFTPSGDSLSGFEIAVAYEEGLPDNVQMTIRLVLGGVVVMEQPLQVNSVPNNTFLFFQTPMNNCKGEKLDIIVTNTSSDVASRFALMTTDEEAIYLDNTEDYMFNNTSCKGRLFCRFTYVDGYSYYEGLTYSFWVFLAGLLLYCKRKAIIHRLNGKALLP